MSVLLSFPDCHVGAMLSMGENMLFFAEKDFPVQAWVAATDEFIAAQKS
jgi:hypothetical protein